MQTASPTTEIEIDADAETPVEVGMRLTFGCMSFFLVNSTLICRLKLCDVRMSESELDLILKDRDCLAEDLSIVKHTLKRILDGHADGSITELITVMHLLTELQECLE